MRFAFTNLTVIILINIFGPPNIRSANFTLIVSGSQRTYILFVQFEIIIFSWINIVFMKQLWAAFMSCFHELLLYDDNNIVNYW